MSYAQAAAKGPKQSPEEARAPPPPQISHDSGSIGSSFTDVSSPHINSEPSRERAEQLEQEAHAAADELGDEAQEKGREAQAKGKEARDQLGDKFDDFSGEAKKQYQKAKGVAAKKEKDLVKSARGGEDWAARNRGNPVVVGNAVVVGVGAGVLGYAAYQKYAAGQLDWKLAGTWAGVVGVFAAGDYFLSKYLFENKFPPK